MSDNGRVFLERRLDRLLVKLDGDLSPLERVAWRGCYYWVLEELRQGIDTYASVSVYVWYAQKIDGEGKRYIAVR